METPSLWEQVLLGIGLFLVLLWFWPGVRAAVARSMGAENPDWPAVIVPLILVVLFVMLLIALV